MSERSITVTAESGYSSKFPENTLLALKMAQTSSVDRLSFQVHSSCDGALVLHHDYILGRTNDGEGYLHERSIRYLKTLDVGRWFSSEFAGERIPILQEVFNTFRDEISYEIWLCGFNTEFLENILKVISQAGLESNVIFISPHPLIYRSLQKINPQLSLGYPHFGHPHWMDGSLGDTILLNLLQSAQIETLYCHHKLLSQDMVSKFHLQGLKISALHCNSRDDISWALQLGVDGIGTKVPEVAVNLRDEWVMHLNRIRHSG